MLHKINEILTIQKLGLTPEQKQYMLLQQQTGVSNYRTVLNDSLLNIPNHREIARYDQISTM